MPHKLVERTVKPLANRLAGTWNPTCHRERMVCEMTARLWPCQGPCKCSDVYDVAVARQPGSDSV